MTLFAEFWRNNTAPVIYERFHLDQKSYSILQTDDVSEVVRNMMKVFTNRVHTKLEVESGIHASTCLSVCTSSHLISSHLISSCFILSDYVWNKMIHVDLLYVRWDPIRGGSFIELPDYLECVSRYVINVKNVDDNMCLVYSILSILFPKKGKSSYSRTQPAVYVGHFSELNLEGFDFNSKMSVQTARADIKRMEKNHENFSICCYIMDEDEKSINCFHISDRDEGDRGMIPINLLFIEKDFNYHFIAITNLKSLTRKLHTKSKVSLKKTLQCRKCLTLSYSEKKFSEHRILCGKTDAKVIIMPPPNTIYKFKDYHKCVPLAFSAYADMETYAAPILGCEPKPVDIPDKSYEWIRYEKELLHVRKCQQCTVQTPCSNIKPLQTSGRHIPYAIGFKVQCYFSGYYENFPLHIEYSDDEDILLEKFLLLLKRYCFELYDIIHDPAPIIMTKAEKKEYHEAEKYYYCQREFDEENKRQADHCHITVSSLSMNEWTDGQTTDRWIDVSSLLTY